MRLLSNCDVQWGISAPCPEPLQNSGYFSFLEYRVENLQDVAELGSINHMCVAHAPDPQEKDWLAIVEGLSRFQHVTKINFHARSEDQYFLCHACGVRLVNTRMQNQACDHCGTSVENYLAEPSRLNSSETLIATIREACRVVPANVILTIENTYEPPHYFAELFSRLPNEVGFTFDVGHANIYHNLPIEYIYLLRARLCHLHLHDNAGGNSEKYHDSHAPPGSGSVNWLLVGGALSQVKFKGTATYECVPAEDWLQSWR